MVETAHREVGAKEGSQNNKYSFKLTLIKEYILLIITVHNRIVLFLK